MDYKLDRTKPVENEFRKAIAIIYTILTALDKELQKKQIEKKYVREKNGATKRPSNLAH